LSGSSVDFVRRIATLLFASLHHRFEHARDPVGISLEAFGNHVVNGSTQLLRR
jgi:hypothetical protein